MKNGELRDYELRLITKNGIKKYVSINACLISDANGNPHHIDGSLRDITDRMNSKEDLNIKNEELQKLNATKDKFFSIIAHDLRSPFNNFLGFTQIMAEELPTLSMAEIQKIAISMSKSANNLFRLLENLLQWAKMQEGVIPFNPKNLKLSTFVDESIEMILEASKYKKIEIINNIPDNLAVFVDRNMFQTILRNLLSNAVKFTPKGGKIKISAKVNKNKSIEISIKDSGIGMSSEMIDNLFRIDVQTIRNGTEGETSSGLGLLLCKEFIEKHGGKILVKSEEGKGSIFCFSIPNIAKTEENIIELAEMEKNQIKNLKILIAEDDEISELFIKKAVKIFSREILIAINGIEAVEVCRNNPDIDLILMDIRMPEMDGYEAARQIRQFNKDVIIIAQTAFVLDKYKERSIESGCNNSISKPIMINKLIELLYNYF